MNRMKWLFTIALVTMTAGYAQKKLTTEIEKISYALGADIGKNFKLQGMQIDADMLALGIRDALKGGKMQMTDEEMEKTVTAFQEVMMNVQKERAARESADNRKAGEEFLAENKKKEGVVTLPNGLQYRVITEGSGPKPTASDQVTVHYRGTLINGKEFDSSYKRNEPATFPLTRVISGWVQGLQMMSVGSKYQFFLPSELCYGDRQMGPDIAPGSTLIFEIELLNIVK